LNSNRVTENIEEKLKQGGGITNMHIILMIILCGFLWGMTAKNRGKSKIAIVWLSICGGVLSLGISFCLFWFIPESFQWRMLAVNNMPDFLYIILFEILPAILGTAVIGAFLIQNKNQ
jgi:flagellar basal body-associated protein FliL